MEVVKPNQPPPVVNYERLVTFESVIDIFTADDLLTAWRAYASVGEKEKQPELIGDIVSTQVLPVAMASSIATAHPVIKTVLVVVRKRISEKTENAGVVYTRD